MKSNKNKALYPVAEGGGAGALARKCPSLVNICNFNKSN
jgi:hypothetical protein